MRITGGQYRGRKIAFPPGSETRPAMSRMRESLFSTIQNEIPGAAFLDLFSGSGLMAIEAASRGASSVDLVEKDRKKKITLETNLEIVKEPSRVFIRRVELFLSQGTSKLYNIVYIDPPFPMEKKKNILKQLEASLCLAPHALVIFHHPSYEAMPTTVLGLEFEKNKKYGQSMLSYYRYQK